jgi:hypothetical protein
MNIGSIPFEVIALSSATVRVICHLLSPFVVCLSSLIYTFPLNPYYLIPLSLKDVFVNIISVCATILKSHLIIYKKLAEYLLQTKNIDNIFFDRNENEEDNNGFNFNLNLICESNWKELALIRHDRRSVEKNIKIIFLNLLNLDSMILMEFFNILSVEKKKGKK